jgi:hypothetical protein
LGGRRKGLRGRKRPLGSRSQNRRVNGSISQEFTTRAGEQLVCDVLPDSMNLKANLLLIDVSTDPFPLEDHAERADFQGVPRIETLQEIECFLRCCWPHRAISLSAARIERQQR